MSDLGRWQPDASSVDGDHTQQPWQTRCGAVAQGTLRTCGFWRRLGQQQKHPEAFPEVVFPTSSGKVRKVLGGTLCSRRGPWQEATGPAHDWLWVHGSFFALQGIVCAVLMGKVQEALLRNVNAHLLSTATIILACFGRKAVQDGAHKLQSGLHRSVPPCAVQLGAKRLAVWRMPGAAPKVHLPWIRLGADGAPMEGGSASPWLWMLVDDYKHLAVLADEQRLVSEVEKALLRLFFFFLNKT